MPRLHKRILAVLLFLALGTAVYSYEMLLGVTFFLDDAGNYYPEGEGAVEEYGAPFIGIIDIDEKAMGADIYYLASEGERIEQAAYSELSDDYYYRALRFESPRYGPIDLFLGDEVIVDDLAAVVACYRVQSAGKWFTAVGVAATEEHQYKEKQREEFFDIIEEFLNEFEKMQ